MPLPAVINVTGPGTYNIDGKPSGRSSLPSTLAVWGTMGGTSLQLQAGFADNTGALNWIPVGAAITTANQAANVAMKANAFRIVATGGSGVNAFAWFG